jgi:multicomponent Na+:H+ antiporter subunit E
LTRVVSLSAVLAGLWLMLSGHFDPLLLCLGALSIVGVVLIARRMDVVDHEGHPLSLVPRALAYWGWLSVAIFKANLDVARRILHPRLPISPTVMRVRADELGEMGKVLYGNSITLTPGTVTLQVGPETLEVHALSREAAEGLRSGEMARRVARVAGRG